MRDQQRQPTFIVAILALLGMISLPQVLKSPESAGRPARSELKSTRATAPEADKDNTEDRDVRDLAPLLDYLANGTDAPSTHETLSSDLRKRLADTKVYSLVITLPDPVESVASGRFDEYLDIVQRAIELQGFILDRALLPWKPASSEPNTMPNAVLKVKLPREQTPVIVEAATPPKPEPSRPGLLVFKHLIPEEPRDKTRSDQTKAYEAAPPLLLAFIVPESPISGIQKSALVSSLSLIDRYFYDKLTYENQHSKPSREPGDRSILHIIAPCFNGSQRSLETALAGWSPSTGTKYHFRIITPSAHMIEKPRLQDLFNCESPHTLSFSSMVHKTHTLKDAILGYLGDTLGYQPAQIAVLVESNSGLAQALVQQSRKEREAAKNRDGSNRGNAPNGQPQSRLGEDASLVEFLFPLQVSELRKAYESSGLLDDKSMRSAGAPIRLQIPNDEGGTPRDLPRSFTPATSAALDELALTQVLTTIARRPYQAVGVFATDPADVVFLLREVRRFCPNVRLFTISSDLLLARPGQDIDLRGMLVASTYPLYPSNQWITTPYHDGPRVFFGSRGSQGLYNATVAHLWEMGADEQVDPSKESAPQLLEFGVPYDLKGESPRHPPAWISVVGERGIYPVSIVSDNTNAKYLYDPSESPERRPSSTQLDQSDEGQRTAALAGLPNPHLFFWLVSLSLMLASPAVAYITWHYVSWSLNGVKLQSEKTGYFTARHVLRWLNCEVAVHAAMRLREQKYAETHPFPPPVGAGTNIAMLNLAVLGLASYVLLQVILATSPLAKHTHGLFVWHAIMAVSLAAIFASTTISLFELFTKRPDHVTPPPKKGWRRLMPRRFIAGESLRRWIGTIWFVAAVAAMLVAGAAIWSGVAWGSDPIGHPWLAGWRLTFERFTMVPSGVSPLFPVLFLGIGCAAGVYFQLARRRFYRQSYLPSDIGDAEAQPGTAHFEKILIEMRKTRADVDKRITQMFHALGESSLWLRIASAFLFIHMGIRCLSRGIPRSLESSWFDRAFWLLFVLAFGHVVVRMLQLTAVWYSVRKMLRLAVQLPISQAYDRVPTRFKGWFFGEGDFSVREQLIQQQSEAVRARCSEELADIFQEIEELETDAEGRSSFVCIPKSPARAGSPPTTAPVADSEAPPRHNETATVAARKKTWHTELATMRESLRDASDLHLTRTIHTFLEPLWASLPVEDVPKIAHSDGGLTRAADWVESWPLTPRQREKLEQSEKSDSHAKLTIVRDWARMAEDLVALQIVRWFAPALSHLLPMMQFIVIGSLCLLLAAMSYPFDHQGWLTVMMGCLIAFVGVVVTTILVGINRDELISRVSDTTPGRITFNSNFVTSLVTMLGPLLGALVAISFDMGDLLRAWFGPLILFV